MLKIVKRGTRQPLILSTTVSLADARQYNRWVPDSLQYLVIIPDLITFKYGKKREKVTRHHPISPTAPGAESSVENVKKRPEYDA